MLGIPFAGNVDAEPPRAEGAEDWAVSASWATVVGGWEFDCDIPKLVLIAASCLTATLGADCCCLAAHLGQNQSPSGTPVSGGCRQ